MKKTIILLCASGLFFQSCHRGLSQDSSKTRIHLIPEIFETKTKAHLTAGTRVYLTANQIPLIKDIRPTQILIFKTSNMVLSEDGEVLIAVGSNGIAKVIRVESKGRTSPDIITLRLESVSAQDGQIIPLHSEDITFSVNLYDREAPLFKKDFMLSGVVQSDVPLRF